MVEKKTIFSGMQPTGYPHLGNYIGAIKNWTHLQEEYNSIYCIVDMHSITVRQNPAELRKRARELMALYIACGLDPEKNIIYYQSHVPAHAELAWILNCYTYVGELGRMTQFKEKSKSHDDNVNVGLYSYPVLMAADILLYKTDLVPVGDDQKQHLEIARDIAIRFNNIYGDVFTVPEPYINKVGSRIMGLQEPDKKMSKSESENPNNLVYLLDEPSVIFNKFKRAITDSGSTIEYNEDKPGVSNLLSIYSAVSGKSIEQSVNDFEGKGYGDFKKAVGEAVVNELEPIQSKFKAILEDKAYLDGIISKNTERANRLAVKTISKVKRKIGFPDYISQ